MDLHERTAPVKKERRHTPRMPVNGPAYVNLAPDNGGIVLNVSEGGLCFQSRAPVHKVDSIRFWFSYRTQPIEARVAQGGTNEPIRGGVSQFIEVSGELAWINDTRKMGGLRFRNLPEAAREQIRDWMHEPTLVRVNERRVLPRPPVDKSYRNLVRLRLAALEKFLRQIQTARLWKGFSGGLVSGLLLSAVLVSLFSFLIQSHKLGDSLVQLGELLGGKPSSPAQLPDSQESRSISPSPQPVAPVLLEPQTASPASQPLAALVQDPPPEKLPSATALTLSKPTDAKVANATHRTPSASPAAARPSVPRIVAKPVAAPDESMLVAAATEIAVASRLAVHSEPAKVGGTVTGPEKYLEVGKFKEKPLADTLVDRITQLDLPVKISPSNRFFGKSYQVLVGPYESDSDAESVHKDLSSHGFTPRSYERGKRDFILRPGLKVGATRLPVGDCVISWESYTPDAIVKIETPRGGTVTIDGKWVKRSDKYPENAIAFVKDRDGSLALLEIRFSGLRQTLVFPRGN